MRLPIKINRLLPAIFLATFYILALALYNRMPDPMASHWNQGGADGYISRFGGMFHLPFAATGLAFLFLVIPAIDPLKSNINRFRSAYDWFVTFFLGFLLYIYVLTLFWNHGTRFDFIQLIVPAVALLIFVIGILMERFKRNYFIGIRTPWTLNNEKVWDRTHKIGGTIFKIAALLTLPGIILPNLVIWFLLVPILGAAVAAIIASFVIYQQATTGN
jgi:uncharacterized membrane protein